MIEVELAPSGSAANGTYTAGNMDGFDIVALVFEVESVGASPAVAATPVGSMDGALFGAIGYVRAKSTTAATSTALAITTVSTNVVFLDGLDKRRIPYVGFSVASINNITFRAYALVRRRDN